MSKAKVVGHVDAKLLRERKRRTFNKPLTVSLGDKLREAYKKRSKDALS